MRVVRIAAGIVLAAFAAAPVLAGAFTVTNTSDSGAGSLRQAINDANSDIDFSTISFNIPGPGVHTIAPATALPPLAFGVIIDGYSQPGAHANTQIVGNDAVLLIELDGVPGSLLTGLHIDAVQSIVRGLVIHGFGNQIAVSSGGVGSFIQGNFLGLLPDGSDSATIDQDYGIVVGLDTEGRTVPTVAAGGVITIGGSDAQDRNVISGQAIGNISVENGSHIVILGNYIGTNAQGTAAVTEQDDGIRMSGASQITIGGSFVGEGNVISGNDGAFNVSLAPATNITILGNRIGTNAAGTAPIPNSGNFNFFNASADIRIGDVGPGEGNTIAYSTVNGMLLSTAATNVTVRGNSFHDNTLLGIAYHGTGVPTPNDTDEADGIQNYPIIQSVEHNPALVEGAFVTRVQGKFHGAANTTFDIDFYTNPPCARFPREFLEGEDWFDTRQVITDGSGNAVFDFNLASTDAGVRVSATATATIGTRNTSEFSQRILFAITPSSGPAAGGTAVTGSGTDLADPATVTVGGAAATGVSVPTDTSVSFIAPALPAGTVNDVVVTTPDGTIGTLEKGWVSDFLDVPPAHQFHAFVTTLVSNAVAAGVGGGNYGVDQATLRQQMAVFLLKASHGVCFTPPACSGVFADVPCSNPFAPWIEQLAAENITGGCGSGNYCPTAPVRRDQMAAFLIKTEHGSDFVPPACVGTFPDVPCSSPFAPWVEQLAAENITGGCGGGNYCPLNSNTRGQMAVFVVKTFGLQ